jgi:hypothetical protein
MIMAVENGYDAAWMDLFKKKMELLGQRSSLEAELSETNTQLAHLNAVLAHLAPLAGIAAGEDISGLGITDAIRWVLKETEERVSPAEVRDKLVEKGFDLSSLTAPMGSIYKILARLSDGSTPEVIREKEDSNVFYRWIRVPDEPPF